jgi:2-amino-4-hydroxy-6-hydroxymethyldihydropteridine diphosphokinase
MKTYTVFIGLGSNIGERQKYLNDAAAALKSVPDTKFVWASPVYESDPYGKTDQAKFLNAVIEIETALEPAALLPHLKSIEARLGRTNQEHWGPREIDLDILLYDGLVFRDASVEVPHPDLVNRRFVLFPLREIAPDLVHPLNGMTVSELLASCTDKGRVMPTIHHIKV